MRHAHLGNLRFPRCGLRPMQTSFHSPDCTQSVCSPLSAHGLTFQVVSLLHHFVGCRNGLGVHFVGTLCHDHINHLIDNLYIGALQIALYNGALFNVCTSRFVDGFSAGRCLPVVAATDFIQTGRVVKLV